PAGGRHGDAGAVQWPGSGSATAAGMPIPALGAGDWRLVRGVDWVEAFALVNISADPSDLFPGTDWLDPLKDATPAWDDLSDPSQ
ncbi:MAG: hypothetical protein MO852_14890, partial [Candidatus Devosia euplotis]|nr:hypothetical protein [Candidatus Devosia euplotis]